jgi:8-oxo-dGTP pyrophosphatase MutT (NUDIX family)
LALSSFAVAELLADGFATDVTDVGGGTPVPRTAGRVLLVDAQRRVLLLEHRIDLDSDQTVWAAPGGGCEPGESPARAAQRELAEECGIDVELDASASAILIESRRWYLADIAYDQTDHFYLVRVALAPPVVAAHRTELEERTMLGHRWFSVKELSLVNRYEPKALPDLLGEAV